MPISSGTLAQRVAHPDSNRPVLVAPDDPRASLTAADLRRQVVAFRAGLAARAPGRGDVVAGRLQDPGAAAPVVPVREDSAARSASGQPGIHALELQDRPGGQPSLFAGNPGHVTGAMPAAPHPHDIALILHPGNHLQCPKRR